jgi:hypothetical protein
MVRGVRRLAWIFGLGLLATLVVVGLAVAPVGMASVEHFTPAEGRADVSGGPSVGVRYTTQPLPFLTVPFNLSFAVSTVNATISPTNLSLWVVIYDVTNEIACDNMSLNSSVATGVSSYTFAVNETTLANSLANPVCNLLADKVGFIATANITNSVGSNQSAAEVSTSLLGLEPTVAGLLSPIATEMGTGNVTFVAFATGQYITGVTLNVANATSGTIVFHSVLLASANFSGLYNSVVWKATGNGNYQWSLALSLANGNTTYQNGTFTIASGSSSTTITTSTTISNYHNQTLIPGVSPAVGGTLLMVIGLLIGIIAALLVGRSMASSSRTQPAQQWSGEQPPKPNTCSVCGQSFGSAEELAAHSKAEHGVT